MPVGNPTPPPPTAARPPCTPHQQFWARMVRLWILRSQNRHWGPALRSRSRRTVSGYKIPVSQGPRRRSAGMAAWRKWEYRRTVPKCSSGSEKTLREACYCWVCFIRGAEKIFLIPVQKKKCFCIYFNGSWKTRGCREN